MKILVTGAAGFIGFHLCRRLAGRGLEVIGVDNFNDYYDPALKFARRDQLGIECRTLDLCDFAALESLAADFSPDVIVNLAAQAGVRYSLENPFAYQKSNLEGFLNILECARHAPSHPRLIYASSSSVYGGSKEMPFSETQNVDRPVSLYAATKKANELMAHAYSHLYDIQTIGLRFFTVYGPWGRPDMAPWLFAKAMTEDRPIKVFNRGNMLRDFTFVDDIIDGVEACILAKNLPKYEVYNIGNHRSEKLTDFITVLANALGIAEPKMELLPMQPGDVPATFADISRLREAVGYEPKTPITVGVPRFAEWFKDYYAKTHRHD